MKETCDLIYMCWLVRTKSRSEMASPPLTCKRRQRHNMPSGSSLVTKQSATEKLTWMRAIIRMNGTYI
jgi:hypothetical protein